MLCTLVGLVDSEGKISSTHLQHLDKGGTKDSQYLIIMSCEQTLITPWLLAARITLESCVCVWGGEIITLNMCILILQKFRGHAFLHRTELTKFVRSSPFSGVVLVSGCSKLNMGE